MTSIITVGKIKTPKTDTKKAIKWSYRDVKYDHDGWATVTMFLPEEFDMCHVKTNKGKCLKAWFTGQKWDGLNFLDKYIIQFWKPYHQNA